ncbi:MAG: hypothetical protein H6981_13055 [Gammaproteobacteria bacterium]|nr:hypothetical protein [Gammaproteobacteria bacterium]MCP5137717.1 hypothetical protein [Gammaproteobacteria bacterium]
MSRASLGAAMLILSGALSATFANDYSMARGDKLQWSPDGAGQFRPMELDPHDPTGNPWLFGEQFHEPQKTALPWVQHPASSRDVIERYEPRPWGEQGRRDRYRGDADRERLRRLQEAPARPYRADGRQTHAQGFDLVPRPVSHQRPLSASADYSVEPSPAVQRGGEDAEVWGSSRRPW